MIQNIEPRKYDVEYKSLKAKDTDYVLLFNKEKILMKQLSSDENDAEFLTFSELETLKKDKKKLILADNITEEAIYLFAIDDKKYFSVSLEEQLDIAVDLGKLQGCVLSWKNHVDFRILTEKWRGFVGITATQIYRWFENHKYCGRCGKPLTPSKTERAVICENCKITEYPKISPAVIVGIIDGDKILLTRYADRPFKRYGLIAGFVEVGETLEETVKREVFEEVGLRVTDITYYKNQPWSFSDSLLVGYFARLEGSNEVTLQESELAEGTWFERDNLPENQEGIALTAEMIGFFSRGNAIFPEQK